MEKAWAKLVGSYKTIEAGSMNWTMTHMTNDPVEWYDLRNGGYTGSNALGDELWNKMSLWNKKEYMMFVGSDKKSYI